MCFFTSSPFGRGLRSQRSLLSGNQPIHWGDFVSETVHPKIFKDTANKQLQSQNILVIRVRPKQSCLGGFWFQECLIHSPWPFGHFYMKQKSKNVSDPHVLLKEIISGPQNKASKWLSHIWAVPCEELSACHRPQSHYQLSALHRRGQTAQPSLPFFSFHLLLPIKARSFPSHSLWYFSFSDWPRKLWPERLTCGTFWYSSEQKGGGTALHGWHPFDSIVLLLCLTERVEVQMEKKQKRSPWVQIWAFSPPKLPITQS